MLGRIAYATAPASVCPFDCGLASNETDVVPEIARDRRPGRT